MTMMTLRILKVILKEILKLILNVILKWILRGSSGDLEKIRA